MRNTPTFTLPFRQHGGTFLGIIIGILIGLFAALIVAVYVQRVPIPFSKKSNTVSGTVEEERARNQNWDPNSPLAGKNASPQSVSVAPESSASILNPTASPDGTAPASTPKPSPKPKPTASAQASDDPLADLVKAKAGTTVTPKPPVDVVSSEMAAEPFIYFVQIGAFINSEEAEAMRAKAAMSGLNTSISEREQAGRMVYRVRMGAYDSRDAAEKAKAKVESLGMDATLVRVQR